MSKYAEWTGYIIGTVLTLCIFHVIAHVIAWASVNWGKYMIYLLMLHFSIVVIGVCSSKYVKVEHFISILGMCAWLYVYNHAGTYWIYYYLMWVCFSLGILSVILRKKSTNVLR